MRFNVHLTALLIAFISTTAVGQQAKLEGQVFDDKERAVAHVRIIVPGGQAANTDSNGHFNINFGSSFQPGQAVRIEVSKLGWVVYQPMFGHCVTQSTERNYEPLRVIIVPKGSPLALSPKRLSQVIARWSAERAKLSAEVGSLRQDADEYAFLRQYANEYGLTLDSFKEAAAQWAQIKVSDDEEERALKDYWQKNYERAARLAEQAAQGALEELRQTNKKRLEASLKVIRRYELAGNSYFEQSKFREALNAYNEIEKGFETRELSKDTLVAQWAGLKLLLGNAKSALGQQIEGEEGPRLLQEGLAEYRQSLTFYTREQFSREWGRTQNNISVVLNAMGTRKTGAEGIKYLNESVAAGRSALEVRTRERSPYDWALTQSNLASSLGELGERVIGAEGIKYEKEALTACQGSLEVRTRERSPQDWATTQSNLGNAFLRLGQRLGGADGIKYLNDSVHAYQSALEIRTYERLPQEWARTRLNLATALTSLGIRVRGREGIKYLNDAVAAYRAVLAARSRERSPQDWAGTQIDLGNALFSLGERSVGADFLKYMDDAVMAYKAALEVITREQLPHEWARAITGLGNAASSVGQRIGGRGSLGPLYYAVTLHRLALEVVTRDSPQRWAAIEDNLGSALFGLGERTEGAEAIKYLQESAAAYRAALEIRTREYLPQDWATTQGHLGNALLRLGERARGKESIDYLKGATTAYHASLELVTEEQLPQAWAATQNNLGVSLTSLAEQADGAERDKYLNDSVAAFSAALEVTTGKELPALWSAIKINLAKAYFQLRNFAGAEEQYQDVIKFDPDNRDANRAAVLVNHDVLFNFEKAFVLNQQWLAKHPEDVSAQAAFAEKHLTTERFAGCEQRIETLLTMQEVPVSSKIALHTIGIGCLLGNSDSARVPSKLNALIMEVTHQPNGFKVTWNFRGTRHFIGQNEKLAPYRVWLEELFDALENGDRDTMLKDLQELRGKFSKLRVTRAPSRDALQRLISSVEVLRVPFAKRLSRTGSRQTSPVHVHYSWLGDVSAEINFAETYFTTARFGCKKSDEVRHEPLSDRGIIETTLHLPRLKIILQHCLTDS